MVNSLKGSVVVITGASSGNGRAAAHRFSREGANVILAARREDVLQEVVDECAGLGGQAIAVPTDVSDEEAVEALGREGIAAFGHIDIWINNAGVLHIGRLDETPTRVLHRVVETNLFGCIHGSRVALRHFRQRGRGILINTSSALGLVGQPQGGAYVATKFAIRGLTEALRQETLEEPDIRVCTVIPAAIDTPIYQRAANYSGQSVRPIRPLYDPDVVAEAMLDLARHPRREAFAGKFAMLVAVQKAIAPRLTEGIVSAVIKRFEIRPEPAQTSDGNLFHPSRDEWKVRGGWRSNDMTNLGGNLQLAAPLLLGALFLGLVLLSSRSRRTSNTQ